MIRINAYNSYHGVHGLSFNFLPQIWILIAVKEKAFGVGWGFWNVHLVVTERAGAS